MFILWHFIVLITLACSHLWWYTASMASDNGTNALDWISFGHYPSEKYSIAMPHYAIYLWTTFSLILIANSQLIPQYLLVTLVAAISMSAGKIADRIENLSTSDQSAHQKTCLKTLRLDFRKVRGLINHINSSFSLIVLASCLRDLMIGISFIATLLSHLERDDEESDTTFAHRKREQVTSLIIFYWVMISGSIVAAVRLTVLLYCCGQVKKQLNQREKPLDKIHVGWFFQD